MLMARLVEVRHKPRIVWMSSHSAFSQIAASTPIVIEVARRNRRVPGSPAQGGDPPILLSRIPLLPCQRDLVEPGQDGEQGMPPIQLFRLPHETCRAARRIDSPHAGTDVNNSIGPCGNVASRHPRAALQLPPHVFHPGPPGNEAIGLEIQQEFVTLLPAVVDRQVDSRTMVMIEPGVMVPPEPGIASHRISDE